jgi:hypothetical protein
VTEEGGEAGKQRRIGAAEGRPEEDRRRPLERVQEQCRRGEALIARAKHIGCADIARADGADVAEAGETRQKQAEGNRAEEVAGDDRNEVHRIGEVDACQIVDHGIRCLRPCWRNPKA